MPRTARASQGGICYHVVNRGGQKKVSGPFCACKSDADPRDGRFQVQPSANGGTNPCLPATGHATMNAAMADGAVRSRSVGINRRGRQEAVAGGRRQMADGRWQGSGIRNQLAS